MKLTLPVYCGGCCGNDVYAYPQLKEQQGVIVLRFLNRGSAWKAYCNFGFLTFNTEKIETKEDNMEVVNPIIEQDWFEFRQIEQTQLSDWFLSLSNLIKGAKE